MINNLGDSEETAFIHSFIHSFILAGMQDVSKNLIKETACNNLWKYKRQSEMRRNETKLRTHIFDAIIIVNMILIIYNEP
jgi:hypothetical protein